MNSFLTLFNALSFDSNIKGKQFEKVTKWFLENGPEWQAQISQVWLWDDYPQRWGAGWKWRVWRMSGFSGGCCIG